ncbi:MAG: hypothetical protein ACI8PZ_005424, partial [Myxococcota bacterium]
MLPFVLAQVAAHACGGFFCNQATPVDQSGEVIVFGVDEAADTVTMHVQVSYRGPAEEFSWVLPVRGVPDIFLSHSALFDDLPTATPRFFTVTTDDSRCVGDFGDADTDSDADSDADADTDTDSDTDVDVVTVLAHDLVGPYDITTVAADDADALVDWLQDNAYDVPDNLVDVLAPYIADDQNFVALKLRKDASTGALSPLALRYSGTTPAVPLTLTRVAAEPDMPLNVYLVGEHRGVPLSFLHVQLNPLAIDYWRGGANLDEAITRAADEAGGQAFVTDDVSSTGTVSRLFYSEGRFDLDGLRNAPTAPDLVDRLPEAGFAFNDEVMAVLRTEYPVPDGFPGRPESFYTNPSDWREWWVDTPFDGDAVVDALEAVEVEPRRQIQAMFDANRTITRLRSSVSPEEMTADPTFGFNPDLPTFDDLGTVNQIRLCTNLETRAYTANQKLRFPSDITVVVPSQAELDRAGQTPYDYLQAADPPAALIIEQLAEAGLGTVLIDNRQALDASL